MTENRLRRSSGNKILGGFCGGLGEYFNIDPTIIRLVWIVAIFWLGFPAIIAYFLGLIVVSVTESKGGAAAEEAVISEPKEAMPKEKSTGSRSHLIWGWLIIGVGVVVLLQSLGYFDRVKEYVFPGALIVAGIWVLIKGFARPR
jgi:phage shock protein C